MADKSITEEEYKEHPELDYSNCNQYRRNLDMFHKTGRILNPDTRSIYELIRDSCIDEVKNHPQYPKFNWKPKIIDIGCGGGFGSNILSQEGDFVWGIDTDEGSINFAKEVFERHKNNIYYTPQLTFERINVLEDPREIMKFDIVVCVEVIEHIDKYEKLLSFMKDRCKKDKEKNPTKVYISTPNRNSKTVQSKTPYSKRHVREWNPAELYEIITKHFKSVILMNSRGEQKDLDMKDSVMLFKCEIPIYGDE